MYPCRHGEDGVRVGDFLYIYIWTHTHTFPREAFSFASQFSPTSAFCHACLICHNVHMLHFAAIWCVRCSQTWTPNKKAKSTLNPPRTLFVSPPPRTDRHSVKNKQNQVSLLSGLIPQVSYWQLNDYLHEKGRLIWTHVYFLSPLLLPYSSSSFLLLPSPHQVSIAICLHLLILFLNSVHLRRVCFL